MYIIKISSDSYKIILSKEDLNEYGSNVFDGGESSKRFFSVILEKVASSHQNSVKSCIAHAEFFEDKFGGGELFLCLCAEKADLCGYKFSSGYIEDIVSVCKAVENMGIDTSSKLFECNGLYHIFFFTSKDNLRLKNIISEYGECKNAEKILLWQIEEHGRVLLASDASKKLCLYFT